MHRIDMIDNMRSKERAARDMVIDMERWHKALDDGARAHPGAAKMAAAIDGLNTFLDYLESIDSEYRYPR